MQADVHLAIASHCLATPWTLALRHRTAVLYTNPKLAFSILTPLSVSIVHAAATNSLTSWWG